MNEIGGYVACMGSKVYRVVVEKPEGNKPGDLVVARRTILKCTLAKQNGMT